MHNILAVSCVLLLWSIAVANTQPLTSISPLLPPLGSISNNGILKFEDIKSLSSPMKVALALLRADDYKAAQASFQKIQRSSPQEALAYRGEIEAAQRLNTLDKTVTRYRKLLSVAEQADTRGRDNSLHLAVLHWALGEAIMMRNGFYPKEIGDSPSLLGEEPKQQFLDALNLDADLLVAHLSIAAYFEHSSLGKGTLARLHYKEALRLRPDLYQLRYLYAYTWDRPGILGNKAELIARGARTFTEDDDRAPEKAIPGYLSLVRDHPTYAPPYYVLGDDYFMLNDKVKAKFYYEKYLEYGNRSGKGWKRIKKVVDDMNEHS